jgi:PAS domain S-box-containing protein
VPSDFEPTYERGIQFFKEGKSRESIRQAVDRCLTEGTPWDLELQIITALGNTRWVRSTGEAESENGKCTRLFGTFQDIHKRKEVEEVVNEAYEEKIAILESIGDAFFAVDRSWTVTYWNALAEKLLRMPREHVLGKNLWEVYPDAVHLAFYSQYHRAMQERSGSHFEEFYPALQIWVEVNVYPSRSGISVYFKDITLHKKRIEEIEKQNMQLKEIAWIQSHEIRAPLARLMGLVNLLKEGMDEESEFPQLLSKIQNSASQLDCLVRKIVRKTEEIGTDGISDQDV